MTRQDRRVIAAAGVLMQRLWRRSGVQHHSHFVVAGSRRDDRGSEGSFRGDGEAAPGRGTMPTSMAHTDRGGHRLLRGYSQ